MMNRSLEPDEPISLEQEVCEAHRHLVEGDADAALKILAPLLSEKTVSLPARFLLSIVAWKIDRLDWSLALMRECHDTWPMEGAVAEVLASLYAQAGNLRESLFMGKLATGLKARHELVKLVPSGFPSFGWAFQHIRENPKLSDALTCLSSGKLHDAIEKARQHAALNLQSEEARGFYASLLLRDNQASAAVDALQENESTARFSPRSASIFARALTAVGEFEPARSWHEKAMTMAPDDPEIAAARIADGTWLDNESAHLSVRVEEWCKRFCAPPKSRRWRRAEGKLVIGYFVTGSADPLDAEAIAAVARAHDRNRVTVIGYGRGAQSWDENLTFQGAFDTWQDIKDLDPVTLARFFDRDALHIILDTSGFKTPGCLIALSQFSTAIRVGWLMNPVLASRHIYDAMIVGGAAKDEARAWHISGGYPLPRVPKNDGQPNRQGTVSYGADIRMPQLDDETIRMWSTLLRAQPNAQLLLRANDMMSGTNIDRLVTRFGRELAARIEIVDGEGTQEFYAKVDIALLPRRGISPRAAAEALACQVPPIAIAGSVLQNPYGGFLQDMGLGPFTVGADSREYVNLALTLATSQKAREQAIAALVASVAPREERAQRFARLLEDHALKALALAEGVSS